MPPSKPSIRSAVAPDALKPHRINIDFTEPPLPVHWNNSAVETHLMNALGLIFPFGERFFVRTARASLNSVKDPKLKSEVKGFIAQETHHAHQHELTLRIMDAQGLKGTNSADRLAKFFEKNIEPRLGRGLKLSAIAAAEHFTATVGEYVFTSQMLEDADPRMKALYFWHAAEEIEHKCVAFDLLQAEDSGYLLRTGGLLLAFPLLIGFWYVGACMLLRQDGSVTWFQASRQWFWALRNNRIPLWVMTVAILDYVRPGFHPGKHDNFYRAHQYFEDAGFLMINTVLK